MSNLLSVSVKTTYSIYIFLSPGDIIDNVGLQEEIPTRKQILSDQILIRPHSHTITHAQRAQHIQNLEGRL